MFPSSHPSHPDADAGELNHGQRALEVEPGGALTRERSLSARGRGRQLRMIQLVALVAVVALHYAIHVSFTVDDADITFAYVRTFVQGHGLGFLFPGDFRVEGYSNATWFALLAVFNTMGIPVFVAAKVLGLVLAMAGVAVAHAIAWRLLIDRRIAGGVVAVSASFVFVLWSASGLENALMAFLVLLLVHRLLVEDEQGRGAEMSAFIAIAIALSRPEGFVFALTAAAFKLIRLVNSKPVRRGAWPVFAGWLAIVSAAFSIYVAWHVTMFGVVFPNTVYAKTGGGDLAQSLRAIVDPGGASWRYADSYAVKTGAILLVPLAAYGAWASRRGRELVLTLVAGAALTLPLTQPDWMIHSRFFTTFTPLLVLMCLIGLDRLVPRLRAVDLKTVLTRVVVLTCVPLFVCVNVALALLADRSGYPLWTTASQMSARYRDLRASGQRVGLVDPLLLIPDIGAPAYRDGDRIIDALGLSDSQTARNLGAALPLQLYLFGERKPDLVRLHWPHDVRSVPLFKMPMFARDYVEIPTIQDQGQPHAWIRRDDLTMSTWSARTPLTSSGGVALLGASTAAIEPGTESAVDILWRRDGLPGAATAFRVTLHTDEGDTAMKVQDDFGYGWLPPSRWRSGEVVRAHLKLPRLASGNYTAVVETLDRDGAALGRGTIALTAGEAAAGEAAAEKLLAAREHVRVQDWNGMWDTCRELANIGATTSCAEISEEARTALVTATEAAYLRAGAGAAMTDAEEIAKLRGRASPSTSEVALASRLVLAARAERDLQRRYQLSVAASSSDPRNAHLQLYLDCARKSFVAGTDLGC